jgi:tripartite-type tricarboxylate transporter receptor subunit TctC
MTARFKANRRQVCLFIAGLGVACTGANAQPAFPTRPVTLIVGWPAGGSADNVARLVGAQMSKILGQQIVIDNRAGAGGNIASEQVARSNPDGYTVMLATSASHGSNSELYSTLKYKPIEDFAPVGLISTSPGTLLVSASSPYKTVRDLIDAAKAHPGKLNYGSGGAGSSQHIAAAMFKKIAAIDVSHIPFKGVAPALTELMAGRLDFIISTGAIPFLRSDKLRGLAVAAHQRLPALPDVPTFDQAGLKGFYTDNWYGLVAPAKTPRPILESLNAALAKTLENPEVQKQFIELGALLVKPMTIDEYWTFVKQQMHEAAELVRNAGAKVE